MAVPRKTVAKKEVVQEVAQEVIAPKAEKRVIDREEWVTIMNYTTGRVQYTSKKTGNEIVFNEFGQTDDIQVSELIAMKNAHKRYLTEPWIIVLDSEVADFLGLKDIYENIISADEVEGFFKLSLDKMEEILKKAPEGLTNTIVSLAMQKIANKTLDSISTIRLIEKVCKVELQV